MERHELNQDSSAPNSALSDFKLEELIGEMLKHVTEGSGSNGRTVPEHDWTTLHSKGSQCRTPSGAVITDGHVACSKILRLHYSTVEGREAITERQRITAARTAICNADTDNSANYSLQSTMDVVGGESGIVAKMTVASAASLSGGSVQDTTGAGDAFIGSILYGLVQGIPHERLLSLAAVVAACKCTQLGARPGLPHASSLDAVLLS